LKSSFIENKTFAIIN